MKLKTWLLLTYFIVMILPLIAAYLLFSWISTFNNDQVFDEHFKITSELRDVKVILDNPVLYEPNINKAEVEELSNNQRFITLYNSKGLVLYSSNPIIGQSLGRERLYKELYTLERTFSAYSYKQPVFEGATLVGFYQIELGRTEWTKGVTDRSWLMLGAFITFFIVIYLSVIYFVNRKFNRRILRLMDEMTAFAQGETLEDTVVNNDELGVLKSHFYVMRNQIEMAQKIIEQEQAAKEYMIATISHDLKTPLTSIKAYTEAIDDGTMLTEKERKEYRKIVIEKADFMQEMIDDLMTYTLLQSSTYEMELVEVDGSEFFEMLVSDYEALCKAKNINLYNRSTIEGSYLVNPRQMMRVTDNLLSNAIHHTGYGQRIWLIGISEINQLEEFLFGFVKEEVVFDFKNYAYLIVQNEGEGIETDKLSRLLEPLYQVDEARNKNADHGAGLGLSITDQIIKKHGGSIVVLSNKNIGTTVICRLPKIRE